MPGDDDESDSGDDDPMPGDDDESDSGDDDPKPGDAGGDDADDNESEDPAGDDSDGAPDNTDDPVGSDDEPSNEQDPESESNIDICTTYCTLVTTHCVKEYAVDFGDQDCMSTCKTYNLDPEANPTASDSLNCRLYHAAAAAKDPAKHCPNVAPGNGELCNGQDPFVDKKVCGDQPNEWPGDIHFSSATMMEGFCQTYDSVCGNITMDKVKSTGSLHCLRWVGGMLQVAHQYPSNKASDFTLILPELHFVGSLFVGRGTTVVQLPKLALVGSPIDQEQNDYGLYIQADSLTELHMPALVSVMSSMHFSETGSWSSKYGLNATKKTSFVFPLLRNTRNLMFKKLWGVDSVEMPKLKTVSGVFFIEQTQKLKTFSAPMLESIKAQVRVINNTSLTALELPSLKHTADFTIVGNAKLVSISMDAFATFQSDYKYWKKSVQIANNSSLESISFEQLKSAGHLTLKNLPALTELYAPSLYELAKDGVTIENVGQLTNLNGLSGLKTVTGSVDIRNNCHLNDVSALSSIEILNGALQIVDNVSLTDAQGLSVKDAIGFENISGGVLIYGNDGTGVCSSE
ncbi:MAG TPA: hypothetical protein EYN66_20430 [Myxococcales bacterium]|nr:hypothetical protein [Myxococcales bacterium]